MDTQSFSCDTSFGEFKRHLFELSPSPYHSYTRRLLDRVRTAMCNQAQLQEELNEAMLFWSGLSMHVLVAEAESTSIILSMLFTFWISNVSASGKVTGGDDPSIYVLLPATSNASLPPPGFIL